MTATLHIQELKAALNTRSQEVEEAHNAYVEERRERIKAQQ